MQGVAPGTLLTKQSFSRFAEAVDWAQFHDLGVCAQSMLGVTTKPLGSKARSFESIF